MSYSSDSSSDSSSPPDSVDAPLSESSDLPLMAIYLDSMNQ